MEQHTQYKYLAWWSAGITSAVACKLAVNAGATKIILMTIGMTQPNKTLTDKIA
jgi:hypothetical protein